MNGCGDPTCPGCEAASATMAHVIAGEDATISNENRIVGFLHCMKCLATKPRNVSPGAWARINVGVTPLGVQIWCVRHNCNVAHISFEECLHPMNSDPVSRS